MSKRITLPLDSRYAETELFQLRDGTGKLLNTFVWGVWEPITFEESSQDIIHTVRRVDLGRLDTLADRYYGNVNLWWVIAFQNEIFDPLTDMQVGDQLRVPAKDTVFSVLLGARPTRESDEEVGV